MNLSSVAGFSSAPMMGAYAASKHAVEGLMKSVREELKPWNIQVVNINPGFFRLLYETFSFFFFDKASYNNSF